MDRKLETIFDLVTDIPKDANDIPHVVGSLSTEHIQTAQGQQVLTMRRIASWLRRNSKKYKLEWDHSLAKEPQMYLMVWIT